MTLKEFREQTKDLDENLTLIVNSPIRTQEGKYGSIYLELNSIKKYPDTETTLKDKLFLS